MGARLSKRKITPGAAPKVSADAGPVIRVGGGDRGGFVPVDTKPRNHRKAVYKNEGRRNPSYGVGERVRSSAKANGSMHSSWERR